MDEGELRALMEDPARGDRQSAFSLTRRLSHIAAELNLTLPAVHAPHQHLTSPKHRSNANADETASGAKPRRANGANGASEGEMTLVDAITQGELLLEQRQQRQAAARERDLIENAWAAFLCRRRLQNNGRLAFARGSSELQLDSNAASSSSSSDSNGGAVFRTAAASLTPVQAAAACQQAGQPFPPLPGVGVDKAFEFL